QPSNRASLDRTARTQRSVSVCMPFCMPQGSGIGRPGSGGNPTWTSPVLRLTGSRAGPVASGRPAGPGRGRPGPPAPGTAASVDARAEVVGGCVEEADVLVAGGADVHRVHPVDDVEAARQAALRHADQHRAGDGPELGAVAPEFDQGGAARVGVVVGAGLRVGDAYDQVALVRDPPG